MESINAVYTEEYCKALELAYGDSMMSEGGAEAIDLIFKDINLKGKKVLDFGSGLVGVAFYLAQHYGAEVTGLLVLLISNLLTIPRYLPVLPRKL